MRYRFLSVIVALVLAVMANVSHADVFNMGDGLTSLAFVTVGNVGNPADDTGLGAVDHVYAIGKYEVTNAQYREFLNAKAALGDPYRLYNAEMSADYGGIIRSGYGTVADPFVYSARNGDANWDNRPVNFVSWGDAARFINWLHNGQGSGDTEDGAYYLNGATTQEALMAVSRNAGAKYWIPTHSEWYKAAYHKNDGVTANYFDYPTSNDSEPSNQLIDPDPGNNANFKQDGLTIDLPYYTTEVGEFENSASPYGTFDQGGNLHEWFENAVSSVSRGLRGGAFLSRSDFMLASNSYFQYPTTQFNALGFRVASVPVPYVASVDVNGGGASRSMVTSLVVTFSQLVTIDAGAFEISQRGTGTAVDVAFTTENVNGKTVATLTFSGDLTEYGSLVDGNYQLTVVGDSVHDPLSGMTLDGDEDGAAGGDYVFGDALVDNFFRLFGDLDGSRFVGNNDYAVFRLAFRTEFGDDGYDSQLDSDGSGFIGNNDYALFRLHFRTGLPFE